MTERKIVVTGATFPDAITSQLQDQGLAVATVPGDLDESAVIRELDGAWGYVLGGSERIGKEAWQRLPDLEVVCFLGTGYSTFLELPEERGPVKFTYTPHGNALAVAEFAIGLMLDIVRRISSRAVDLAQGRWSEEATPSLVGAKLGIVGMGHIGREIARMAECAFGMDVRYWNRTPRPELAELGYTSVDTVEALCAQVDVLSVTCDYQPGVNDGLIGASELAALDGGYLVTTSRAELVDPTALRAALESGSLKGAALDGYYREPTPAPADDPYGLIALVPEKLTITPHCAYLSTQAVRNMADMAAANLLSVAAGENPPYEIPKSN
jgi:phosphoglycerate dehydrogenase-like enzyme